MELPNIVSLLEKIGLNLSHILRFVPQGRGEQYIKMLELHPEDVIGLRKILVDLMNKSDIKIIVGAH